MPRAPSILIVTCYYPPSRAIGAKRPLRMARGLRDLGWRVTVLTTSPSLQGALDLEEPADPGVELVRSAALMPRISLRSRAERAQGRAAAQATTTASAAPVAAPASSAASSSSAAADSWAVVASSAAAAWSANAGGPARAPRVSASDPVPWRALAGPPRRLASTALSALEFPDAFIGWLPFAVAAMRGRRFDVVLATLPPRSVALVGAAVAKVTGARLVLDYRDPWSELLTADGSYGESRAVPAWERTLHRRTEDAVLRQAALTLAVTPTIQRWLSARTSGEVVLLPNGLDAMPPEPPPPRTWPLRLVYAGSLAYERSLDPLLQAMADLRPHWDAASLRLLYAGPHGADLRRTAVAHGVADAVEDLGALPWAEARALYVGAAAGVVSVSARTGYSYPGKLFEILAAGCPIWLSGPNDCDAATLVLQLGAGTCDDGRDRETTAARLRALLHREPAPLSRQGLADWQAARQIETLDALLSRVVGRSSSDG